MYMHIHIYICVYTCMYTNICILKNSSQIKILQFLLWGIDPHPSSSRLYIYKHLCIYIHTHIHMYMYTYVYIYMYTSIYIYIYVHIYTCMRTCMRILKDSSRKSSKCWRDHHLHLWASLRARACVCRTTASPPAFISVTGLIHTGDMAHSCVWHDSFIRVTWLLHTWVRSTTAFLPAFICVTWLVHTHDMNLLYVWHDFFIRVTWPI